MEITVRQLRVTRRQPAAPLLRLRVKRNKEDSVVVSALLYQYQPTDQVNVLLASTETDSL